ncbi:hypothetical protein D3C84_1260660 [compost metagenome]
MLSALIPNEIVDKPTGNFNTLNLSEIGPAINPIAIPNINIIILINCTDCCVADVFLCKKSVIIYNR